MERPYKRSLLPGPAKTRIQLREQKSLVRRSERSEVLMRRRNIVPGKEVPRAAGNIVNSRLRPVGKPSTSNHSQEQTPDVKPTRDQRKLQLLKYKENKILKKKLEKELAKPVFKVSQYVKNDNPFIDLQPNGTKVSTFTSEKRVTRSMAAINKTVANKKVSDRTVGQVQRRPADKTKKEKAAKDATFVAPVGVPPQKANVKKETERRSFAPDNFVFNPLASWKTPVVEITPLRDMTAIEECIAIFSLNNMKASPRQKHTCALTPSNKSKPIQSKPSASASSESRLAATNNNVACSELDKPSAEETSAKENFGPNPSALVLPELNQTASVKSMGISTEDLPRIKDHDVTDDQDYQCVEVHFDTKTYPSDNADISKAVQSDVIHEQFVTNNISSDVTALDKELVSCEKDLSEVTESSVKRRKFRFAVGLECSPWITTSRGSSSRKKRRSLSKTVKLTQKDIPPFPNIFDDNVTEEKVRVTDASTQNDALTGVTLSTQHFENLVSKQKEVFLNKISVWSNIEETTPDIPEKALGKIHCAIGLARLLMNQRMAQFEGLILDCKLRRGEKEITCEDLLGFWEMVALQIEDIDGKFGELEVIRARCWQEPESVKPVKRKKALNKKPMVKKAGSSKIRQFLNDARKAKAVGIVSSTDSEGSCTAVSTTESCELDPVTMPRRRSVRKRSVTFSASEGTQTPSNKQRKSSRNTQVETTCFNEVFDENKGHTPSTPRRKSVRFLVNENSNDTRAWKYRTTPFLCFSESKLLLDDVSTAPMCDPLELSFKEDMGSNKKVIKREPSLLPMPDVDIKAVVTSNEDLMRFSPLTSIENTLTESTPSRTPSKKRASDGNILRRSSRLTHV